MSTNSVINHSVNYQPGLIIVNFPYSYVTRLRVSVGSDMIWANDSDKCAIEEMDGNKKGMTLNMKDDGQKKLNISRTNSAQFFLHTTGSFFNSTVEINGKFSQLVFSYYKPFDNQLESKSDISSSTSSRTLMSSPEECKSETVTSNSSFGPSTNSDPHTNSISQNRIYHEENSTDTRGSPSSSKRTQIHKEGLNILIKKEVIENEYAQTLRATENDSNLSVPIGVFTHDLNILVYGHHLSHEEQLFREEVSRLILEGKYGKIEKMIVDWYIGDKVLKVPDRDGNDTHGCSPDILRTILDLESQTNSLLIGREEDTRALIDQERKSSEINISQSPGPCSIALLSLYLYIFLETCDLSFIEQLYGYMEIQEYKKTICAAMKGVKGEIVLP